MSSDSQPPFFSLAHLQHFLKFGVVGVVGVVVNEGLLIAFLSIGVHLLYASTAAIEISILSNFLMNDLWTFRDRRSGRFAVRLLKFNLLMLAGLVVNAAVLDVGTDYFGIAAAVSNLIGIGAAFFLRYALSVKYAWMRIEAVEEGSAAPVQAPLAGPRPAAS
ncbi:MAG TPA: GtrA family protein [Nitrososphaerales archaeon]|nr:GtrA family protein [Nitrososphaerales archaeon]